MDESILLFFNGHHTAYWDDVVMAATYRFTWIPMYVMLAYAIARSERWRTALLTVLAIALTIVIADRVGAGMIRPWAERLRPSAEANPLSQYIQLVDGYRGGLYGMPSCHAANTVGLVTIISLLYRHRAVMWTLTVWALIQMWTRMYLGVHYPTDILAGTMVGIGAALISWTLWRWAYQRWVSTDGTVRPRAQLKHTLPFFVTLAALTVWCMI